MISYTFKLTFEDLEDVSRVIEIFAHQTFSDFHQIIQKAINFDGTKPSSFYVATDNWRKGKEITNSEKEGIPHMKDARLRAWIVDPHQKFVYVTDFEAEWTLLIELMKIQKTDETKALPAIIKSVGEAPKQYENPNRYVGTTGEFDTIAEDMVADRINDDEEDLLEGEEGEENEDAEDEFENFSGSEEDDF